MGEYIHGGTDQVEVARLEKQAEFSAPRLLEGITVPEGGQLLDLGTGVGAMARELKRRFPDARLTGLDLSFDQLTAASRRRDIAHYACGDAAALPFRDRTFDVVHASWFLEHVPDPLRTLREARRVLKPGGRFHVTEVENASLCFWPALPAAEALFTRLNETQARHGGHPFIGRKLWALFNEAGFPRVVVEPTTLHGTSADPHFFEELVEEFAGIFDSVKESVGQGGGVDVGQAVREIRSLLTTPGASMTYTFFRATGHA